MDGFNISGVQYSNSIFCIIDGDDIVQADAMGNRKLIGKRIDIYNELEQTTAEYYDKLVELGVIVPPKTPEEQNAELQATLATMATMMQNMQNEIKELKQNGHKCTCSDGDKDVSKRKNNRSGSAGSADVAGDAE